MRFLGDELRACSAESRIIKGALVHIKSDWAEVAHTFGLPTWRSVMHPCFCLQCHRRQPGACRCPECYVRAFPNKDGQEVRCGLQRLCVPRPNPRSPCSCPSARLSLVWQTQGWRARASAPTRPSRAGTFGQRPAGATAGSSGHQCFGSNAGVPTELTFWHPASETIARRRNPLFCADVGAGIYCTTMRSASSCRRLPSGQRARVHGERERAHAWKQ